MRKLVYTVIIGEYDTLQPVRHPEPDTDYWCYSDHPIPEAESLGWQNKVALYQPDSNYDKRMLARRTKINSHKIATIEYEMVLYHDANLQMKGRYSEIFSFLEMYPYANLIAENHPKRDCAYMEWATCRYGHLDTVENLHAIRKRMFDMGYPRQAGLFHTAVILRRPCEPVTRFNRYWSKLVQHGSIRDQISFPVAIAQKAVNFQHLRKGSLTGQFVKYEHLGDRHAV